VIEGEDKRELWADLEGTLVPLDIFNSWPAIRGGVEAVLDRSSSVISPSSRLSGSVTAVIDDGVWSSLDSPSSGTASAGPEIPSVILTHANGERGGIRSEKILDTVTMARIRRTSSWGTSRSRIVTWNLKSLKLCRLVKKKNININQLDITAGAKLK